MAVWQFVIDFVPEQFLLDTYGCLPETIPHEDWNKGWHFKETSLSVDELLPYLQVLGTFDQDSGSATSYYWGEGDNDARVFFEKETRMVEEASCRINMRQPTESFIYSI